MEKTPEKSDASDKTDDHSTDVGEQDGEEKDKDESELNMVTIVIKEKEVDAEEKEHDSLEEATEESKDDVKSSKGSQQSLVTDADKDNTEEMKNKRNSLKGKIDLSKIKSKIDNKSTIIDTKKRNSIKQEKKIFIEKKPKIDLSKIKSKIDNKSAIAEAKRKEEEKARKEEEKARKEAEAKEKEAKRVKRVAPKSKWDAIMNKIETSKTSEPAVKPEPKSKLEAFRHIPPPAPKKKEEPPKPKRIIKMTHALPDLSKVQSKLKYTAAPPKPKPDTPNGNGSTSNIAKLQSDKSPSGTATPNAASPKHKPTNGKMDSLSPRSNTPDNKEVASRRSQTRNKTRRINSVSPDSVKRPEIRGKSVRIDLAGSLDRRSNKSRSVSSTRSQSVESSRGSAQESSASAASSMTDLSGTEEEITIVTDTEKGWGICFSIVSECKKFYSSKILKKHEETVF